MQINLKDNIERMLSKISDIEDICVDAQIDSETTKKLGKKYVALSRAIGKVAVLVRDTATVRNYWYAKFVEDGVLVPRRMPNDSAVTRDA